MIEDISRQRADRGRRILRNVTLVGIGLSALCASQLVCIPTAIVDGVWLSECPSGDLRQSVVLEYENLQREAMGTVKLRVNAHYTTGPAEQAWQTFVRLFRTELTLVYPDGEKEVALEVDRWNLYAGVQAGGVRLPRVPDGDYKLRARVRSAIEEQVVDVPLPLYAPARVHVITDRPLYEPGNTLQFRAVVLSAYSMAPLPERPGKWIVVSADGEVLLEEATRTDEWGVVAGSFPLDRLAGSGTWTVRYVSGQDSGESAVTVEPFTLPRFRIEARARQPYSTAGDIPVVTGKVVYSSGAPVSGAALEISWQVLGDWPAPTAWQEGALPRKGLTDKDGTFRLTLPPIPGDLQGQATLVGRIAAVDAAGDRVSQGVSILLSKDRLSADVVTELGDGLAEGFNNRTYLRVTTPDGIPLPGATVTVRRAWDRTDKGQQAVADADGVAALQIDPGAPVTVVIPPPPVRPPPRRQPVQRTDARDLLNEREATLAERLALDPWIEAIEPCARFVSSGVSTVSLGLSVAPSGQIEGILTGESRLETCIAESVAGRRLPAGSRRLLRVDHRISDPELPTLSVSLSGTRGVDGLLRAALDVAALDARGCLPDDAPDTVLPRALLWETAAERETARLRWASDADTRSTRLSAGAVDCIERTLLGAAGRLGGEASFTDVGVARVSVSEAPRLRQRRPEPTVMMGYELAVSAQRDGTDLGETLVRLSPAQVPDLRIRATPVIAAPGTPVTFEFIRGPGFSGTLPEEVLLQIPRGEALKAELDAKARTATFALPADAEGWYTLSWGGAISRVYVPDQDELALALSTEKDRYAPGERVTINVQTSAQASVGLIGVDQSLGQLAPLPGPESMAEALVLSPEVAEAFAGMDGQALVMGRIQGDNAAAATVLRVNSLPALPDRDRAVSGQNAEHFDPLEGLTDSFYTVLGELHLQTRAWEKTAPEDTQMTPEIMAGLWDKAVAAVKARGEPCTDAYGRTLRLRWLPYDLLALTAPHEVVLDSTRLPEDIVNWIEWVHTENP